MPRADRTDVGDVLGEARQQRTAFVDQRGIATDQQIQPARRRLLGGARHWRVDETATGCEHRLRHPLGRRGHRGRAVDHHGAGAQFGERAVGAQQHRLDLGRTGDAHDQHVDLAGQVARAGGGARASGCQRVEWLVARMLEQRQRMTPLDQVARDAVTHQADADQADFARCHDRC
jgi:hypothetical protein